MFYQHKKRAGYRKIHKYLINSGYNISCNKVRLTMSSLKLKAMLRVKRPYNTIDKSNETAFPNLIANNFTSIKPNTKWYTDFTYLKLENGKVLYACFILDSYDKSVIAYQLSNSIDTQLAIDTLQVAINRTSTKSSIILHSDQGVQFRAYAFKEYCKMNNIVQSMSRAGTPTQNAVMENFVGKIKCEFLNHNKFKKKTTLNEAIIEWTYNYYNTQRVHSALGYKTPMQKRNEYYQKN